MSSKRNWLLVIPPEQYGAFKSPKLVKRAIAARWTVPIVEVGSMLVRDRNSSTFVPLYRGNVPTIHKTGTLYSPASYGATLKIRHFRVLLHLVSQKSE